MNVLDLFSGIGGFSLGLERAGMRTVAFCEIDPYCRRVLAKHWPGVPCYDDVTTLTVQRLAADGIIQAVANTHEQPFELAAGTGCAQGSHPHRQYNMLLGYTGVDVICGGFPCQDISHAGKGAGIGGARSGLWSEFARIIGEVRPRYAIVENVAALLGRGIERVLGDLAALGYDAEWHCIPASAVGAPHRRDRVWIVAYAGSVGRQGTKPENSRSNSAPCREGCEQANGSTRSDHVADAGRIKAARYGRGFRAAGQCHWWRVEPDVGRVAHGVPARVDRLRSLGNAVVPQIPEIIGRAIMTSAR